MRSRVRDAAAAVAVAAVLSPLFTGCASTTGARPRPFPQPAGTSSASPRRADPGTVPVEADNAGAPPSAVPTPPAIAPPVAALLTTALDLRGVPYRNGGSDPNGFDCSGFTQWVFARNGVRIPREVRDQFRAGLEVAPDTIAAGDLVFFATTTSAASHVGIALGDGTFVHAPNSRGVVRVERLAADYWSSRYLGSRRYFVPLTAE